MKRIGYLVFTALLRLLSALGGLWILLLLSVAAIWASNHMVELWSYVLLDVSATLCLLVGVPMIASRLRVFAWMSLYGSCVIICLAIDSLLTSLDRWEHSAGLAGALVFFALTLAVPLHAALFAIYDLRRTKSGDPQAAAMSD